MKRVCCVVAACTVITAACQTTKI